MAQFRHAIHKNSPELMKIAHNMRRDGYYLRANQKRKVTKFEKKGDEIILTGDILSPL